MEGLERSPGEGKGRRRHPGRKCIRAQIAVLCVAPSAPDLRPTYVLRMNHSRAPRAENTQGAPGGRRGAGMGRGGGSAAVCVGAERHGDQRAGGMRGRSSYGVTME